MSASDSVTEKLYVSLGALLAVIVMLGYYAFQEPARLAAAAQQNRAELVEWGSDLYSRHCVTCHGKKGVGTEKAPPHNTAEFQQRMDDRLIRRTIDFGRQGTLMRAWLKGEKGGTLTAQEVEAVLAFIRNLDPRNPNPIVLAEPGPGDPTRGKALYAQRCAKCHGQQGEGLRDRGLGPPLNDQKFLAERDDEYIWQVIAKGRRGTTMPRWELKLGRQEINDLVAFIRSWQR